MGRERKIVVGYKARRGMAGHGKVWPGKARTVRPLNPKRPSLTSTIYV